MAYEMPLGGGIHRISSKIERCTRCIQLQFAFMHLDVTPMDPDRDPRPYRVGEIYHSPG